MRTRVLAALALTALVAAPAGAASPRTDDLVAYTEGAMQAWQVPGVAIAVVSGGKVVHAGGLGVREAGKPGRVSERTLFPIASLTKGFTAALAARLVEDGVLAWDDRVADLLPGFAVADPWVSREVRLSDLLSHRTGWDGKVDLLWPLGYDRSEILARFPLVTQAEGFRSGYSYLNVTYLVAGEAMARRAGRTWEELVRERLLVPLGMSDTVTGLDAALGREDRIRPHSDLSGDAVPIDLEDGEAVAPAAAMHSTAADLGRWLLFHLGDGSLDGKAVLPAGRAQELREPRTLIPRGDFFRGLYPTAHFQAYALGWVVQDHHGRLVVWNTGGVEGAACSIAFVPEEGLGVAVLTNGPRISFPEAIVFRALDAWLGVPPRDWSGERLEASLAARKRAGQALAERRAAAATSDRPALPHAAYAGRYREPLLGELAFAPEGEELRARWQGIAGRAEHRGRDRFEIVWDNAFHGTDHIGFVIGQGGAAARVEVEGLGSFARVPD